MELHHVRTFVVVAQEQNVTRAAQRLYMTPPAVSAHIKALEKELNITLFLRTPQGMQLTEKGALLRAKADDILKAARDMLNHATQMQDSLIGRLTIGLNASPRLLRVAPLIAQMRTACPGIEIAFTNSVSGLILNQLQSGALNAGFIFGASPHEAVLSIPLTATALVVAAPREWESQIRETAWEDLARFPWITSSVYCPFQEIVDEMFRDKQLAYPQIVQSDDEVTKAELVGDGLGLALLERTEAEHAAREGKVVIWEGGAFPCELSFALMKDQRDDPLIAALTLHLSHIWFGES